MVYDKKYLKRRKFMSYIICTDSSANLPVEIINQYSLKVLNLSYMIDGETYSDHNMSSLKYFYEKLRTKVEAKTSCVNQYEFEEFFTKELKENHDVLYIGFSSGLSATFQAAKNAADEVNGHGYKNKVVIMDSLCAALGQGLLVHEALMKKEEGKSLEEVLEYCENLKLKINHLFTVEDLFYLYRGGRVSKGSFFIASLAKIKPVLRVDENGKLEGIEKCLGRKRAIKELCDKICSSIIDPENNYIYISHGDCLEDVELAKKMILEKIKVKGFIINFLDPVIGTHAGPGCLAIFYKGTTRIK